MTLVWADGMHDQLAHEKWTQVGVPSWVYSTATRHASGAGGHTRLNSGTTADPRLRRLERAFAAQSHVFVGTGFGMFSLSGMRAGVLMIEGGGNPVVTLNWDEPNLLLEVRQGAWNGTLLFTATSGASTSDAITNVVAVEVDAVAGAVRLYKTPDGLVGEATGLTLANPDLVGIAATVGSSTTAGRNVLWEDLWVATTNLLDARVASLRPGGPGNAAQWQSSDGAKANWEQVSKFPPDLTAYVSADTPGTRDSHAYANLPTDDRPDVAGVIANARASKTDETTRNLVLGTRLGGVNYDAAAQEIVVPGVLQHQWNENPAGGAWTKADVDGAEFAYEAS